VKLALGAALFGSLVLHAQTPAFEVASVKRNTSGTGPQVARMLPGGRAEARNFPLNMLIRIAYGTEALQTLGQVVGGPGWIRADRWDVVAKADGDPGVDETGRRPQVAAMLRGLLEDRFHLKVHTEMREVPVYALVLANNDRKPGPQLHTSSADFTIRSLSGRIVATGATMEQLSRTLATFSMIGRPVVDKTALAGKYDFELEFAGTNDAPAANAPAELGSALFTSLPEQLGLKLHGERGAVQVLVIDHVERPSED
jgi:uncharacterized protein (TIGR03435 family)